MTIFRWLAAGAIGVVAYRAWRRHRDAEPASLHDGAPTADDAGDRTPPHGDSILAGAGLDVGPPPATGVQSSRGFGAP